MAVAERVAKLDPMGPAMDVVEPPKGPTLDPHGGPATKAWGPFSLPDFPGGQAPRYRG